MKKTILFGDIAIVKHKFHDSKYPINISNVNIDKIKKSDKVSFSKKVKPLYVVLPKISGYIKK